MKSISKSIRTNSIGIKMLFKHYSYVCVWILCFEFFVSFSQTSNLPTTTIVYYAIDVGFRRLESSLYEPFWDATADALNEYSHLFSLFFLIPFVFVSSLSQYLFNISTNNDIDAYLHEAKCQLLMYASIAMIKMNTIVRKKRFIDWAFFAFWFLFVETTFGSRSENVMCDYLSSIIRAKSILWKFFHYKSIHIMHSFDAPSFSQTIISHR